MTLATDYTEHGVLIEEDDDAKIRIEEREEGVVIYSKDSLSDGLRSSVEVWNPESYKCYRNDSFHQELKDNIETMIMTNTTNSHLMERGSLAEEAIRKLN